MPMTRLRDASRVLTVLPLLLAFAPVAALAERGLPQDVVDGAPITLEEVRANSKAVFDAIAGQDGGPVSRQEFLETEIPGHVLPARPDRGVLDSLFTTLDADGDGSLTRAEWNARIESDLQMLDADGDGEITVEELANARENIGFGDAVEMIF